MYIEECIESVLAQTYSNFELLLVDDGSPDKSGEICDKYQKKDFRIKVFHKHNQGLIHTRRYAIERASGDYYIFLDSDDCLKNDALEIINKKIQEYECECLVYGLERVENGKVISQVYDPKEEVLCDKREIYRKVFNSTDYNSLCRKAVKASVFHNIDYSSYYHLKHAEDLLQSLEIYKYSDRIAFIPNILYSYRMNPNSITHVSGKTNIDYTIRKRVLAFLQNEPSFSEEDLNQYRDYCINTLIDILIMISLSDETYRNKLDKLSGIRNDSYYQEFLIQGISEWKRIGAKAILYYLFQHGRYSIVIALVITARALKRITK